MRAPERPLGSPRIWNRSSANLRSILIVDDDPEVLESFQAYLQRKGFRCPIAPDALSAMRFVRKGNVDLVLTDYHMPEVTGLDLLKEVRAFDPKLPVILMSGAADMRQALETLREHAFDFLPKPIDSQELLQVIQLALAPRTTATPEPMSGRGLGPVFCASPAEHPGTSVVYLNRPLDEHSVKAFDSALRQLRLEGAFQKRVVLALRNVSYINSVGLNFLLETLESWKQSGVRFALVEISDPVYRYLKLLGYLDYVPNATTISQGAALVAASQRN